MSLLSKMSMAELKLTDSSEGQLVAVLEEPGRLSLARAEIPAPGDGEVRVRIKWVGICGSDLEAYRGVRAPEFVSLPARLGHEVAGYIDAVGGNVMGWQVGQPVALRYVWGCFAQYVCVRPVQLMPLPPGLDIIEGSLVEVLPSVLNTMEMARIDPTKNVLIMGQGVSGLILTQAARLFGPRALAVTDLFKQKLEFSSRYGATHTYALKHQDDRTMDHARADFPGGFDIVIPCLLEGDGIVDAIDACAQNGRILLYGCIGPCRKTIDFFKVHRKRVEIFATEPRRDIDNRRLFEEGMLMVSRGLINTRQIITHTFPLTEIQAAFELRNKPAADVIHVMIDCEL